MTGSCGQWHQAPIFGATLFVKPATASDASADAFGAQAFFDLESENDPAEGLRISLRNRSEFIGPSIRRRRGPSRCGTRPPTPWITTLDSADARHRRSRTRIRIYSADQDDHRRAEPIRRSPWDYLPSTATTDDVEVPQDGVFAGGTKDVGPHRRVSPPESDVRVAIIAGGTAPADNRDRRA